MIVWEGGFEELPPIEKKVKVKEGPSLSDEKHLLTRRGEAFFGARGFSLSGGAGRYMMTFRPALKKFQGVFREGTIRGETIAELKVKLEGVIKKLEDLA